MPPAFLLRLKNLGRPSGQKETSAALESQHFPQGIKVFVDPPGAVIDVVFVHGLTGDREKTWTFPVGIHTDIDPVLWPRDLLPKRISNARILTFGYDAYVVRRNSPVSTNRIRNHAKDLINSLAGYRKETRTESNPIIFVAHSLGGLVCKDAIIISYNSPDDYLQSISKCAIGVAFLGTPHGGSVLANWAKIPAKSLGILKQTNIDILSVLETSSEVLSRLQDDFLTLLRRWARLNLFEVTCFYETLPMPKVGIIVPNESAILPGYNHISLHADHRGIARYNSARDPCFISVATELERWIKKVFDAGAEAAGARPTTSAVGATVEAKNDMLDLSEDDLKYLQSLSFPEMEARQFAIERAAKDTCLLWIKGKPGSGKSTLMKRAFTTPDPVAYKAMRIGYFFNARGAYLEKSPPGLYRSLLHQLGSRYRPLLEDLSRRFRENEQKYGRDNWQWHLAELREIFHRTMANPKLPPLTVYIDALDECSDDDVRQIVRSFEESARQAILSGVTLNICFASRHYPHISVNTCFEIRMEDQNRSDIGLYVHAQLQSYKTVDFGQEIEDEIARKANGVFLWTAVVVRKLFRAADEGRSRSEMKDLLTRLPSEIDELFKGIYESIPQHQRPATLLMVQWVLGACRPLSAEELALALAFSTGSPPKSLAEYLGLEDSLRTDLSRLGRFVTETSGGLFEVVVGRATGRSKSVVQVIHESVREFLAEKGGYQLLRNVPLTQMTKEMNQSIVQACMHYLSVLELRYRLPSDPATDSASRTKLIKELPHHSPNVEDDFTQYVSVNLFKHVEAAEGLPGLTEDELRAQYRNAFNRVVSLNAPTILRTKKVDGFWYTSDDDLRWITTWASRSGTLTQEEVGLSTDCIQALHNCLECLPEDFYLDKPHLAPHAFVAAAHCASIEWMTHLLDRGVGVDSVDLNNQTALHEAAAKGHIPTALFLLARGANIEGSDRSPGSPLFSAVRTGGQNMVQLLCDNSADVTAIDLFSNTPLHMAARSHGSSAAVQILLRRGAEIEARNDQGYTPLAVAASRRNLESVRELLAYGADIESPDFDGNHPLALAAMSGDYPTIDLLIASGADVNAKNNYGKSALYLAIKLKYEETALRCIRAGALLPESGDTTWPGPALTLLWELKAKIWNTTRKALWTCYYCDGCGRIIPTDWHHHCGICQGGDFDICQNCYDSGTRCLVEKHQLYVVCLDAEGKFVGYDETLELVRGIKIGSKLRRGRKVVAAKRILP